MSRPPFYKNIHFLFIAGGLVVNFLLALVYYYINIGGFFFSLGELSGFYTQGWPIVLQTIAALYFNYYAIKYFDKKFKDHPNSFQRFSQEVLFIMVVGFAVMDIFRWIFVRYMVVPEEDMAFLERKLKMIQMIDITFLIVIYALMTSFRIFRYLQQKQLEVLKWQREYTQSQFEAMKNQLNPHFLFNSLNALTSLVYVDAGRAEAFIEKLSKSYRYLLEQKDKEVVPVKEELQFIQSFIYLLQERFGKKLQVAINNLQPDHLQVPPHSLMIVMEYIINNNSMSAAKPLTISIDQQDDNLLITYNYQPKNEANEKINEQLLRLREEYAYLTDREMMIEEENGQIVLPLIRLQ